MVSKHYKWQLEWAVNLEASTATHSSGLVVQFTPASDTPGAHDGRAINVEEVSGELLAKHGPHNVPQMLARLMREAGEVYTEARRGRH